MSFDSEGQNKRELASGKLIYDEPVPHVARLRIDNPNKRGALDQEILDAIAEHIPTIEARCLIVTGTGNVFSAGYDIGGLPEERFAEEAEKLVAHPFTEAITALTEFPFPTIGALNGHTIGGGLELALSCDIRICAEGAKLGMPPAKLGLVYSHDGLDKFIQTIGPARTRELFFTAQNVSADRALKWGLVNYVRQAEAVSADAVVMAESIAANAPCDQHSSGTRADRSGRARRAGPPAPRVLLEQRLSRGCPRLRRKASARVDGHVTRESVNPAPGAALTVRGTTYLLVN
jgi:enoyl-CoA hydratase/carnithine racemase